jgi:hypothetical protein
MRVDLRSARILLPKQISESWSTISDAIVRDNGERIATRLPMVLSGREQSFSCQTGRATCASQWWNGWVFAYDRVVTRWRR